MQRILKLSTLASIAFTLSACANLGTPVGLQQGQTVAIVNSLNWSNSISGKRDGVRTSWPVRNGQLAAEPFTLTQLKHCNTTGGADDCSWGVMRAQRSATTLVYQPDGADLSLVLDVDVARRQELHQGELHMSLAIPQDVSALSSSQRLRPTLHLKYGQVQQLELDYGVRYQVCLQRYDAQGKVMDRCEIPFI